MIIVNYMMDPWVTSLRSRTKGIIGTRRVPFKLIRSEVSEREETRTSLSGI